MKKEQKLFKPDYTKLKFKITIDAFENCATVLVTGNNGYNPNYHE